MGSPSERVDRAVKEQETADAKRPWFMRSLHVPHTTTLHAVPNSFHVDDPTARTDQDHELNQATKGVERLAQPEDISLAEMHRYGYSPADLMWHTTMIPFAEDQRRQAHQLGMLPPPGSPTVPVQPQQMSGAQSQQQMRDYSTAYGPLSHDPLELPRRQVEALGDKYVLPTGQDQTQAFMTIAGQLEARRRALGGQVDIGSPWNVLPGTY